MADFSPLKKIFVNKDREPERPQAGARFGVSWPLLIALSLVLVCAVAWSFFMGYMVGKGEHPAESLGAMTGLGQSAAREEAPVFVQPEQEPVEPVAPTESAAEQPKALAPPSGAAVAAWPQPAPRAERKAEAAPRAPAAQKAAPGSRYNYTFQVAAIRNRAEAEKMRTKLAGMKLKASVQKSGKVYLLLVNLRGDATDVDGMRAKLKSVHLGKPLQLSKTPVAPAKKERRK